MKISNEFDTIVGYARDEAMRTGSYTIGADHLFLGILRHRSNRAVEALHGQGIDTDECKRKVDSVIFHEHSIPFEAQDDIRLGRDGSSTVNMAIANAMAEGAEEAGAMHLLKAVMGQEGSRAAQLLRSLGFVPESPSPAKKGKKKDLTAAPSMQEMSKLLSTIRINTKNFS